VAVLSVFDRSGRSAVAQTGRQTLTLAAAAARNCLERHDASTSADTLALCLEPLQTDDRVLALWLTRAEGLSGSLAGLRLWERRPDPLDRKVLDTGTPLQRVDESGRQLRLTLPFPRSPRCLRCHERAPETLGTLSLRYDLSPLLAPLDSALLYGALLLIAGLLAVWLLHRSALRPYRRFVEDLSASLEAVERGDFTRPVPEGAAPAPIAQTAARYNRVLSLFKESVDSIVKRFNLLIRDLDIQAGHPLERAAHALRLLARAYRFRYAVERDRSIFELYEQIVTIVRDVTGAEHFSLYSVDRKERVKTLVYSTAGSKKNEGESGDSFGAFLERFELDETGFEFPSMTRMDEEGIAFYFCIPVDIDEYVTLIIALFARTKEELDRYRGTVLELRYYLENIKPVIESKILTQKLREQSLLDGLTGLYNRKFLEEFIDKIDNQAKRSQTRYAVLMVDIDFFKRVNDTYGHDTGDRFIRMLGTMIRDHIRASDIAVRYGGEEFLILLHESSPTGAVKVAETLRREFSKRVIRANGKAIRKTLSIGIAFFPDHTVTSLREAIKYADVALYRAKEEGRDRIVVFQNEMLE